MEDKLKSLKEHVTALAADPKFVHHKWFTQWHLQIVERIALELLEHYPEANRDVVIAMVWLHDYGKIIDFDEQYSAQYIDAGRDKLLELGFDAEFAASVAANIARADQKTELDKADIEVQIVASADGCSHLVGPFIRLWWHEHPNQPFEEIMAENVRKLGVDWERKVVLPEARAAFQVRHDVSMEQSGKLPSSFLKGE
ncbi:MAG TPA: HD domain-containing protein [Bacillota bacterium]|nr:HD domain-containing protein [Bacillota bacterium]